MLKINPLPHLSNTSIFDFFTLATSPENLKKRWGRGGVETLTKSEKRFNAPENQKGCHAMGKQTSRALNQLTGLF